MNIQKMMKQAQEMQTRMAQMQESLEAKETEGQSGGGMVKVALNGKSNLLRVSLDPSLLAPDEKEVLEDLIIAAYNDAKAKVEDDFQSEMAKLTGGLNLPAGFKLPF